MPEDTAAVAPVEIRVPKEVFNADSVFLIEWLVAEGASVEPGTAICELETSKSTATVEVKSAGYLRHGARAGEELPVGSVLAYVSASRDTPLPVPAEGKATPSGGDLLISAKARRKIEELGLDPAAFSGQGLVREEDVLRIAGDTEPEDSGPSDPRGPSRAEPMGPIQRRVARVLEESTRTVPVSYLERVVDLEPARTRASRAMEEAGTMVSAVDVLVMAVARAAADMPRFNGFVEPDYRLRQFERVNVGLAVDVGDDLYVVVVRDAAEEPLEEIAAKLRALQYKAQRRRLTPEDSTGGTITVTAMLGHGAHRFHPLLYPEQAAIVGICDHPDSDEKATLTLGFDHRIANGLAAAAFLGRIQDHLVGDLADRSVRL